MRVALLLPLALGGVLLAAEPVVWDLWPAEPPDEAGELGAEHDTTTPDGRLVAGRRVMRITNVSKPTLTVHKPRPEADTGTAVIVAPGGGHRILAWDLEGTEVCEWLTSIGITGILLKYRVPFRDPDRPWLAAAQDGQRAVSVVRGRAQEIGVDPGRIGIMGFSAGGTPVRYAALVPQRLYGAIDRFDDVSFRPDFAVPIYAGGIPEQAQITADCPPFFMVITHDDQNRSIAVAELYIRLKQAGVPAELHIYESGGHGYGLRKTDLPVTSWPARMQDWLRRLDLIGPQA